MENLNKEQSKKDSFDLATTIFILGNSKAICNTGEDFMTIMTNELIKANSFKAISMERENSFTVMKNGMNLNGLRIKGMEQQ